MKRTALYALASIAALSTAHAETFTFTAPTQTTDDAALLPASIKAERLVCSGPTPFDVRVASPALSYSATLTPGSYYICKLQTIAAYECSITDASGGAWTMGLPDAQGNAHMYRDGGDTGGMGTTVALVGSSIAAIGTDGKWWTWSAPNGWSPMLTAPQLAANTPQIFAPSVLGECASAFTPDLAFNAPIVRPHRLRPKAPTISKS